MPCFHPQKDVLFFFFLLSQSTLGLPVRLEVVCICLLYVLFCFDDRNLFERHRSPVVLPKGIAPAEHAFPAACHQACSLAALSAFASIKYHYRQAFSWKKSCELFFFRIESAIFFTSIPVPASQSALRAEPGEGQKEIRQRHTGFSVPAVPAAAPSPPW